MSFDPVDQNGEIARSFLRRQPVRIVGGRVQGGWTSAFELICCDCGDNPYLGYSEISPRLQRLRGPYTVREGFAAYEEHPERALVVPDASPSEEPPRRLTLTRGAVGRSHNPVQGASPGHRHLGLTRPARPAPVPAVQCH
jgi:hypothetical protein